MSTRTQKLQQNYSLIFWVRALMNVKLLNIVMSIFYIHRGIELHHIFYLSIIWSIANLLSEIPSSYIADKWGRKKTIILSSLFGTVYWIFYFFAGSLQLFILGTISYGLSIALLSGTDEALLFDTTKELKQEKNSLKHFGNYHLAMRVFKIFAPIVGILIAQDLSEQQFQLLIIGDLIVTLLAVYLSTKLTEANHYLDLQKQEAGIIQDSWNILKNSRALRVAILNKVFPFIAVLLLFHYFHTFFISIGVSLTVLGIGWSIRSLLLVLIHKYIYKLTDFISLNTLIDSCLYISSLLFVLLLCNWYFFPHPIVLYALFILIAVFSNAAHPLHSEFFNTRLTSYNRATTLSMSNFLKSLLDIPIMFTGAIIIQHNIIAPYWLAFVLIIITLVWFRVSKCEKIPVAQQISA